MKVARTVLRGAEAGNSFRLPDSSLYFYVGTEYHQHGTLFETATFALRANARWVRFEIVDDRGRKAWSNPFDLTALERAE